MADRIKRRRNAVRNNLLNKVIPSVENTLQRDAVEDDEIEAETNDSIQYATCINKILIKIKRKIESMNRGM